MVKIPARFTRVHTAPRTFHAHSKCCVRTCPNRAIARVQFANGGMVDVCEVCVRYRPMGSTIVAREQ